MKRKASSEELEAERLKLEDDVKKSLKKYLKAAERLKTFEGENFQQCLYDDTCYERYDFKRNRIKFSNHTFCTCGKMLPRKDFKYIITEDYVINRTLSDCGTGDEDRFQWQHEFKMFRVCPNCGALQKVRNVVVDGSKEWTKATARRNRKNIEDLGNEFKPKGWKGRKVIFCGSEKECEKRFTSIRDDEKALYKKPKV